MNYRVDFKNEVECNFVTTDEKVGEYYDADGNSYEVYSSFTEAKKRYIEMITDAIFELKFELKTARKLKKKDVR